MPKHHFGRSKIHEIVSQFIPALLEIPHFTRKRYLTELEGRRYAGKPLASDEERVRRVLQTVDWLEADEARQETNSHTLT